MSQSSSNLRLVSWTWQWVHFTQMASTVTRSQSNRAPLGCGEIRIMDVQPTNLQQLRDAIMSIWTKISGDCFRHLVESISQRIKAVLKAKGVQPGTSKVKLKKVASGCICICTCIFDCCFKDWYLPLCVSSLWLNRLFYLFSSLLYIFYSFKFTLNILWAISFRD